MSDDLRTLTYETCTDCCLGRHYQCNGCAYVFSMGAVVAKRQCACLCRMVARD